MPRRLARVCPFLIALAVTVEPQFLRTQEFRATLTGRVTDAQNAAIPDARITATLISTKSASGLNWTFRRHNISGSDCYSDVLSQTKICALKKNFFLPGP